MGARSQLVTDRAARLLVAGAPHCQRGADRVTGEQKPTAPQPLRPGRDAPFHVHFTRRKQHLTQISLRLQIFLQASVSNNSGDISRLLYPQIPGSILGLNGGRTGTRIKFLVLI